MLALRGRRHWIVLALLAVFAIELTNTQAKSKRDVTTGSTSGRCSRRR